MYPVSQTLEKNSDRFNTNAWNNIDCCSNIDRKSSNKDKYQNQKQTDVRLYQVSVRSIL